MFYWINQNFDVYFLKNSSITLITLFSLFRFVLPESKIRIRVISIKKILRIIRELKANFSCYLVPCQQKCQEPCQALVSEVSVSVTNDSYYSAIINHGHNVSQMRLIYHTLVVLNFQITKTLTLYVIEFIHLFSLRRESY